MKIARLLSLGALFPMVLMAQNVIHDYDRSVDLSKYKTFAWVKREKPPIIRVEESADPRLSSEALDSQIHSLVEKELEKRVFEKRPMNLLTFW